MEIYNNLLNKIKDDLSTVKMTIIPTFISIENMINNIEDEEMQKSLLLYKDHSIIAYVETSAYIRYKIYEDNTKYLYFIMSPTYEHLYVAHDSNQPELWKLINLKEYTQDQLYDILLQTIKLYNKPKYPEKTEMCHIRGLIGTSDTLNIDFEDFQSYINLNNYCEHFVWGSYFDDFIYRNKVKNTLYSNLEIAKMLTHSLYQSKDPNKNNSINTYTLSSYSLISVEDINSVYVLDIYYVPDVIPNRKINDGIFRDIPDNLPLDLLGIVCDFPFVTHLSVLQELPLTDDKINIALDIAHNSNMSEKMSEKMYNEILERLEYIVTNHNLDNEILKLRVNRIIKKLKNKDYVFL